MRFIFKHNKRRNAIQIKQKKKFKYILSKLSLVIYMLITIGITVFNLPFKYKIDNKKEIAIARVSREKEKLKSFSEPTIYN